MVYVCINENNVFSNDILEFITSLGVKHKAIISENVLQDTFNIAQEISQNPSEKRAIIIDEDGTGPFMVAAKIKNIICAQLNDEQSALMTRDHNNTNIITVGSNIVGIDVIKGIIERFLTHDYAGGRHQVRVDMLNSMVGE